MRFSLDPAHSDYQLFTKSALCLTIVFYLPVMSLSHLSSFPLNASCSALIPCSVFRDHRLFYFKARYFRHRPLLLVSRNSWQVPQPSPISLPLFVTLLLPLLLPKEKNTGEGLLLKKQPTPHINFMVATLGCLCFGNLLLFSFPGTRRGRKIKWWAGNSSFVLRFGLKGVCALSYWDKAWGPLLC